VLEPRANNPVSVKNLTAIETSTIVKLLRAYVPVGTKRTRRRRRRRRRGRSDNKYYYSSLNPLPPNTGPFEKFVDSPYYS
jgi:hypothetical protein